MWTAGKINSAFLSSLALFYVIFAPRILGLFSSDTHVIEVGASCLRFICYAYPLLGFGMTMMQAFNGAGDTWTPTRVNLVAFWVVQIPLAWVLSQWTEMHETGLFVAIFIAQCVLGLMAITLFRRGAWKLKKI